MPTGGAVPRGADSVVMLEYTEDYGDGTIGIAKSAAPGQNMIFRGDDVFPGKVILKKLEMPESEFSKVNTVPFGSPKVTTETLETDGRNDQHVGVLNAFIDAITTGAPMVADGREGIFGLTLSNAMHLSAWLGKEIELPFDEAQFKTLLMEKVATSRRKENVASVLADTSGTYNS